MSGRSIYSNKILWLYMYLKKLGVDVKWYNNRLIKYRIEYNPCLNERRYYHDIYIGYYKCKQYKNFNYFYGTKINIDDDEIDTSLNTSSEYTSKEYFIQSLLRTYKQDLTIENSVRSLHTSIFDINDKTLKQKPFLFGFDDDLSSEFNEAITFSNTFSCFNPNMKSIIYDRSHQGYWLIGYIYTYIIPIIINSKNKNKLTRRNTDAAQVN